MAALVRDRRPYPVPPSTNSRLILTSFGIRSTPLDNRPHSRGAHAGPSPTDRSGPGCKRHIVTDADGPPLVVRIGPANRPDGEMAPEMLDAIPPCGGRRGRPRRRPGAFRGDGAYGIKAIIAAVVARRGGPPPGARREGGGGGGGGGGGDTG